MYEGLSTTGAYSSKPPSLHLGHAGGFLHGIIFPYSPKATAHFSMMSNSFHPVLAPALSNCSPCSWGAGYATLVQSLDTYPVLPHRKQMFELLADLWHSRVSLPPAFAFSRGLGQGVPFIFLSSSLLHVHWQSSPPVVRPQLRILADGISDPSLNILI